MDAQPEKQMKNKDDLVTVAIHTYDRAHILKSILESEGIPVVIHGVRMIDPVVPGNVRVRIRESDLPMALRIIEQVDFSSNVEREAEREPIREILVPVDFSDYSFTACEFGFRLAHDLGCDVKLMHAFFTPLSPASIPFGDYFTLQATEKEAHGDTRDKVEKEMELFVHKLEEGIAAGEFPKVSYMTTLVEGLPEDEIIEYSKRLRPMAIVMGTRGRGAKELDLIGSVTAEVMDGSNTPIFAVPVGAKVTQLSEMKRIVFLTNFQEREFKALDIMIQFLKPYPITLFLAHLAKKEDVWNEIKLSGFRNLLAERYPRLKTEYRLIDFSASLEETLENFVQENAIDMISLSSSRRNIFARIFNPGIARRMLFHSDTPLLVIKGMV